MVLPSAKGTDRAEAVCYEGDVDQMALQAYLARFIVDTRDVARLTQSNIDTFFHKDVNRAKLLLFSSHLGRPKLHRLQKLTLTLTERHTEALSAAL